MADIKNIFVGGTSLTRNEKQSVDSITNYLDFRKKLQQETASLGVHLLYGRQGIPRGTGLFGAVTAADKVRNMRPLETPTVAGDKGIQAAVKTQLSRNKPAPQDGTTNTSSRVKGTLVKIVDEVSSDDDAEDETEVTKSDKPAEVASKPVEAKSEVKAEKDGKEPLVTAKKKEAKTVVRKPAEKSLLSADFTEQAEGSSRSELIEATRLSMGMSSKPAVLPMSVDRYRLEQPPMASGNPTLPGGELTAEQLREAVEMGRRGYPASPHPGIITHVSTPSIGVIKENMTEEEIKLQARITAKQDRERLAAEELRKSWKPFSEVVGTPEVKKDVLSSGDIDQISSAPGTPKPFAAKLKHTAGSPYGPKHIKRFILVTGANTIKKLDIQSKETYEKFLKHHGLNWNPQYIASEFPINIWEGDDKTIEGKIIAIDTPAWNALKAESISEQRWSTIRLTPRAK